MAIIQTLNTLLACDTSNFDRGMDRGVSGTTKLAASVRQQANVVDSALQSFGVSGLVSLSRLGPQLGVVQAHIAALTANVRTFVNTITTVAGTGARVGAALGLAFAAPLLGMSRLIQQSPQLVTAIVGAVGRAGTAVAGAGASLGQALWGGIAAAAARAGGVISGAGGAIFGGIGSAATGAIGSMVASMGGAVVGRLGSAFSAAGVFAAAAFQRVSGVVGPLLAAIAAPVAGTFSSLWAAVSSRAVAAFGGIGNAVVGVFQRVGGAALPLLSAGIAAGLSRGGAAASAIGSAATSAIGAVAGRLGPLFSSTWAAVSGGAASAFSTAGAFAAGVFQRLGSFIPPALLSGLASGLSSFGGIAGSIASAIINGIKSAAGGAAAAFGSLGSGIVARLGSAFSAAGSFAGGIFQRLAGDIPLTLYAGVVAGLSRLGGVVGNVAGTIRSGIRAGVSTAADAFGPLGTLALSALAAVPGQAVALFSGAWTAISTRAVAAFAGIGSFASGMFQQVTSAASSVMGAVAGWFGNVSSAVGAAFNRIAGVIGSVIGAVGNVVSRTLANVLSYAATVAGAVITTVSIPIIAIGATIGGVVAGILGGFAAVSAAGIGLAVTLSHLGSAGAQSIASISVLARELGMNVHALSAIANTSGIDPDAFAHAVLHMQREIETGGESAARALTHMGLSLAEMRHMAPLQQLEAVYSAFGRIGTQGERTAIAMGLFSRHGLSMMESLGRGTAGLDEARRRADRFGVTFTEVESGIVRRSLRAWGQWSLAMEGVSRKLAVIFAPIWESIGNIGGNIGERLVAIFSDRQVVQSIHGLWGGIAAAAQSAWDGISSAVATFWNDTLGLSNINANSLKDVFMTAMVTLEFGFRNIAPLARHAWAEIKVGALEMASSVVNVINTILEKLNLGLLEVTHTFNQMINAYNHSAAASAHGRMNFLEYSEGFGHIPTEGLANLLEQARAAVNEGRDAIAENFSTFMANRLAEIRTAAANMGRASDDISRANRMASSHLIGQGGNGVATAGSEEAYRVLESRSGNVEAYVRANVEATQRVEQTVRDLLNEFRRAPMIGRAAM